VTGKMQLLSCSTEEVYDAVTDYPRAPEIFGNIAESSVTRDVCASSVCPFPAIKFSHVSGNVLL
jgi:hypothetical protein